MKKKHLLLSIILLCILFSLTACGRQNSGNSSTSDGNTQLSGKHHVAIEVNNYGTIEVELDADTAPITVTNFINLANCTSQQKVDTTLYFYTSFNEHNTPYTVLESDNSESMPDVLH